jgi:putative flippase GtrA
MSGPCAPTSDGWRREAAMLHPVDGRVPRAHAAQSQTGAGPHRIQPWLRRVCGRRIVRYGLVGGLGIPVNNLALALIEPVLGGVYWLAAPCAFEIGTLVNFTLNQRYTYSDQTHLRGWDWPKRALKAQLSSVPAWGLALLIGCGLTYGLHVHDYVASDAGFACAFGFNFVIANRFVFTPAPVPAVIRDATRVTAAALSALIDP